MQRDQILLQFQILNYLSQGNSSLTLTSSKPTSINESGNSYELKIPFNGFANGTESLTITIPSNSIFDMSR